jgi:pimeloyl-ACP methyl ester carboxylesterase
LRRCRPRFTHAAAEQLRSFARPVQLSWSRNDPIFPEADARRLAETIPHCTLRWIDDSRAFSMIDQPEVVVQHLVEFVEAAAQ